MKIEDSVSYMKNRGKRPAGVVLAFEQPQTINEVILYDQWRLRILQSLTRDEFMERLNASRRRSDHTCGMASVKGSRIDLAGAENVDVFPPEMKFFYAAELV